MVMGVYKLLLYSNASLSGKKGEIPLFLPENGFFFYRIQDITFYSNSEPLLKRFQSSAWVLV
jgi:hypothetical protein